MYGLLDTMNSDFTTGLRLRMNVLVYLVRSLGFDTIVSVCRKISQLPYERAKVAVTDFLWSALSCYSLHAPPVAVNLYLVIIKLKGRYIGEHLGKPNYDNHGDSIALAFIRVAARIQVRRNDVSDLDQPVLVHTL